MTREEYLKQLIIEDSGTLKDFAKRLICLTRLYILFQEM